MLSRVLVNPRSTMYQKICLFCVQIVEIHQAILTLYQLFTAKEMPDFLIRLRSQRGMTASGSNRSVQWMERLVQRWDDGICDWNICVCNKKKGGLNYLTLVSITGSVIPYWRLPFQAQKTSASPTIMLLWGLSFQAHNTHAAPKEQWERFEDPDRFCSGFSRGSTALAA